MNGRLAALSDEPGAVPDPRLVHAWLAARSLARGLPPPWLDRGGFRVDTGAAGEQVRWVFAAPCDGLREIGRAVSAPYHLLKLCGTADRLMARLPPRWSLQSESWFMEVRNPAPEQALAPGYRLEMERSGPVSHARIFAEDGAEAARGYAAETAEAFVYDRIATVEAHRRKGLGRVLMAALGSERRTAATPQVLTATAEGRALYESLGWRVLSPYATAGIEPSP